jgi:hypothetical protein
MAKHTGKLIRAKYQRPDHTEEARDEIDDKRDAGTKY